MRIVLSKSTMQQAAIDGAIGELRAVLKGDVAAALRSIPEEEEEGGEADGSCPIARAVLHALDALRVKLRQRARHVT